MKKDTKKSSAKELRKYAEEIHENKKGNKPLNLDEIDALKLVHELEVHQIELELQCEELLQAKQVARDAADKYTQLYDFAPAAYFTVNSEGEILNLNLTGASLLEKDRSMLTNKIFQLFVSSADRQFFSEFLDRIFSSGKKEICEISITLGEQVPKYLFLSGIASENGDECHITAMDISESKKVQMALSEGEERMRLAVAGSPIPIMIHDEDGKVLQLSKGWTEFSGYTILDIPTLDDWTEKAYGSRKGTEKDYIDKLFEINETVYNGEWHVKAKDGSMRIWEFQTTPLGKIHIGKRVLHSMAVDITDRKQTENDLIKAKERAEESDRLKSAFLANMSHEIRTPMNGILGFSDLLKEPGLTGEQQQKYIDVIQESGARMLNIITDIIDISKIESGLVELSYSDVRVDEQLKNLNKFFKQEAEIKGIELIYKSKLSATEALITTDVVKLQSILTNLLKNAIKYTRKGKITFGCAIVDGLAGMPAGAENVDKSTATLANTSILQFFVKDTGIGIAKNRQHAIFERFVQADIEDVNAMQGAGLGLSITKAYIEMLGGRIWMESIEGQGTTFYFTISVSPKVPTKNKPVKVNLSVKNNTLSKKLKILIAEDDEPSGLLLKISLRHFSTEIIIVESGKEAVEICRNQPDIDLVLMDIKMPLLNGYDATRQIRQFNKDIIIIAQTAYGLSGDHEKAIEAGCNDYISKPIKKERLITLLNKWFK